MIFISMYGVSLQFLNDLTEISTLCRRDDQINNIAVNFRDNSGIILIGPPSILLVFSNAL